MAGQKMGTVRRNSFLTGLSGQEEEELGRELEGEAALRERQRGQWKTQTGIGLK